MRVLHKNSGGQQSEFAAHFLDNDNVLTTVFTVQLLYSFWYLLQKLLKSLALDEVHLIIWFKLSALVYL